MITISRDFDLGRDRTRIKDTRDGERQRHTVEALLRRMYHEDPDKRWELQLLADEVGMGKTFVSLALAYSVLAALRAGQVWPGLGGCASRVLVISPQNAALTKKWQREVGEFVRRCMDHTEANDANTWFRAERVERLDDLARNLRASEGAGVLVIDTGVLRAKFKDYDAKRRFLLGGLFRFWGVRFGLKARARLLKGAPDGWPARPGELTDMDVPAGFPFSSEADLVYGLRALAATPEGAKLLEAVLSHCKEIAEPFTRRRDERFEGLANSLNRVYRRVLFAGMPQALPLVIVDEAHNWKNGPKRNANGYRIFQNQIAPLTRRLLLLTATPFQLHPNEMLELLHAGTLISPCADPEEAKDRRGRLERHRESVIGPVLRNAASQSRAFAAAWSRLPATAVPMLERAWAAPELRGALDELRSLAREGGEVGRTQVERVVASAVANHHPDVRDSLREALRLYTYNQDLSHELGVLVVRHRRRTEHRMVKVGGEFVDDLTRLLERQDRHLLHSAPGIDVRGEGELLHYILMRCVSEMKRGKGRASLGSALTGCYSTLLASAEGQALFSKLAKDATGQAYLKLLRESVDASHDPQHPKVGAAVDSVLRAWRAGEKTLIFCFRNQTAKRLQEIIDGGIRSELESRQQRVLGGEDAFTRLRSRLTRRDDVLFALGLDRVLWSIVWAARSPDFFLPDLTREDFTLTRDEIRELARLGLRFGVDLRAEQMDRLFLHRATEHLLARRLAGSGSGSHLLRSLLEPMTDESWVRAAYGVEGLSAEDGSSDAVKHEDAAVVDERGVHTTYAVQSEDPSTVDVDALAAELIERTDRVRRQSRAAPLDAYAHAPSFWLGVDPMASVQAGWDESPAPALIALHKHLLALMRVGVDINWRERLAIMQALRRSLLRRSALVRLLPERHEREVHDWGTLLVEHLFRPLAGQRETTADRMAVFVEDLHAASGSVLQADTARHALYEATRMRETSFAVLVDGSVGNERRERVFAGFNSPLLPEVLICTSVGQEGIDLHRHCRHVIHYDLAWNPAVLEQRTGRVDRIGSKTFRERDKRASDDAQPALLDVGVPFLAGTYDERMYEELRIRAQTFEVLTGGEVTVANREGEEGKKAEGAEEGLSFPVLPRAMIEDLKVNLHVWTPPADSTSESGSTHGQSTEPSVQLTPSM